MSLIYIFLACQVRGRIEGRVNNLVDEAAQLKAWSHKQVESGT